ncbi:hypothetical protein BI081_gp008 [Mycobacterium phage Tonenili]|uniref:Uncharacterized protein n=1 Tax=Mycobacterium phage Tonenili TaxID=1891703 RepID=A0A1C9EGY5_9CAUD|nr:hypothetical protein BI081_gp008 [Mycobacterium phage Tonenili]AON96759.1 hypothetical protein SEA_TONENILI_8 [Mycobacterium phage Tonenili]
MRAEIVPFHVEVDTDADVSIHGDRFMVIPDRDEEVGICVKGQPGYLYMPPEAHPQLDEESVILLAGNIQVTWSVREWQALTVRMDELIAAGRRSREATFGVKS